MITLYGCQIYVPAICYNCECVAWNLSVVFNLRRKAVQEVQIPPNPSLSWVPWSERVFCETAKASWRCSPANALLFLPISLCGMFSCWREEANMLLKLVLFFSLWICGFGSWLAIMMQQLIYCIFVEQQPTVKPLGGCGPFCFPLIRWLWFMAGNYEQLTELAV